MNDRRFYPYLALHTGIVALWVVLELTGKGITNGGTINLLSISVLICFFNLLYLHAMTAQLTLGLFEYGCNLLPPILLASLMYIDFNIVFTIVFLLLFLIATIIQFAKSQQRGQTIFLFSGVAAACMTFWLLRIAAALIIVAGLCAGIFHDYRYANLKRVNILPVAQNKARYVLVFMIPLTTVILYFFNLNTLQVNVLFQIMMLLFEAFAVIHLGDAEIRYKELTEYYNLTKYIANEREDFSRTLHNDILQDIGGAKNLLSLRSPEVEETKKILSDLEVRIRAMMNFYSSNIYSEYASWENIGYMVDAIKAIYPLKHIQVSYDIQEAAKAYLKRDDGLEPVMQVCKELINNVYKHSSATYYHLNISLDEKSNIVIACENDGVGPDAVSSIISSKGGLLFLNVLVSGTGGNLRYYEKDGVLTAKAVMVIKNENPMV